LKRIFYETIHLKTFTYIMLGLKHIVHATENGADSFALGAEGMMAGALPPPGVYLLTYYQNYHAGHFDQGPQFSFRRQCFYSSTGLDDRANYWGGQLGFYAIQLMVDLDSSAAGMSDHNTALGDLMLGSTFGWHLW
jgi:hypothetical protein